MSEFIPGVASCYQDADANMPKIVAVMCALRDCVSPKVLMASLTSEELAGPFYATSYEGAYYQSGLADVIRQLYLSYDFGGAEEGSAEYAEAEAEIDEIFGKAAE